MELNIEKSAATTWTVLLQKIPDRFRPGAIRFLKVAKGYETRLMGRRKLRDVRLGFFACGDRGNTPAVQRLLKSQGRKGVKVTKKGSYYAQSHRKR